MPVTYPPTPGARRRSAAARAARPAAPHGRAGPGGGWGDGHGERAVPAAFPAASVVAFTALVAGVLGVLPGPGVLRGRREQPLPPPPASRAGGADGDVAVGDGADLRSTVDAGVGRVEVGGEVGQGEVAGGTPAGAAEQAVRGRVGRGDGVEGGAAAVPQSRGERGEQVAPDALPAGPP